jgi:hypothetical protein
MNSIYVFLNLLYIIDIPTLQKNDLLFLFICEINTRKNINFTLLKNNILSFEFDIEDNNINKSKIINNLFDNSSV